jgi:hypothetical protein
MTFLPVVGREMGVLARRSGFYWARAGTALASLIVVAWFLAITGQSSFLTLGRSIFTILSWVGLVYAMVAGVHATADCISEEKREGTLGLLFLTDLRSYDIVLGKLSASSLGAAYALAAIVPMISLGLLVGGVTLNEIAEVAAILANTLFFSLSLGVFISTLSRNERQSVFGASVPIFLLTVGPFAILFWRTGFGSLASFLQSADIAWVSLAYPMLMLQFRPALPLGISGASRLDCMLLYHLLGWGFLILSCVILPRFVHEVPRQRRRFRRAADPAMERAKKRGRFSQMKLLDKNAFLWLALREGGGERGKPFYAWFLVVFFIALFGWVGRYFPNLIFDMPINLVLLITLHFTLKLWMGSEVCQRLVQDRRAGALELLLSTPLKVREIAQGQALVLRRIFGWPLAVLVLGEIAAAFWVFRSGLQRPGPLDRALTYVAASSTLIIDAWALNWVGQWRALRGKSVERVLASTLAMILAIPWIAYITIYGMAALLELFAGMKMSYRAHLLTWWAISAIWSLALGWPARTRFLQNFREYAANRFESPPAGGRRDPRAAAPTKKALPRSWRPRDLWREHPAAFIAGSLIAALFLFGSGRKLYWRYQLRSEVRKVRKEGFPTRISEMTAYIGSANSSNGVKDAYLLLATAGNPVPRYTIEFLYRYRSNYPGDLAKNLQSMQPQLTALRTLTNYGGLKVSLRSDLFFGNYGSLGCVDYMVAAQEKDEERAYADMAGLFKLIGFLRHCGLENAQPYALSILAEVMRVLQSDPILRGDQLGNLARMLEEMDSSTAFQEALVLNRAPLLDPEFDQLLGGSEENPMAAFVFRLLNVIGSFDRARVGAIRVLRSGIEVSAHSYPERIDLFAALNASRPIPASSPAAGQARNWIEEQIYASIVNTLERDAEFSARLAVLNGALAMRRAKLDGVICTNLTPLVPKYLATIPIDPFSGAPIRVLLYNGRTEVYSLGQNRVDDANTRHQYNSQADIVFVVP